MKTHQIRPATYAGFAWLVASLLLALLTGNGDIAAIGLFVLLSCLFAGDNTARWERQRVLTAAAEKLDAQATAHHQAIHDYTDLLRIWADNPTRWERGS